MRITTKHAIITALLGCFILSYMCARIHIAGIERDLIQRTKGALASEKIQQLEVFANGRDVVLAGVALDEEGLSRALARARNVPGVFRVKSRLHLRDTEPTPTPESPDDQRDP